jgi:hypothetical protein
MSLPSVVAPVSRFNPKFVRGGSEPAYIPTPTIVEVVQLNLNTGGMRVRWNEPDAESKKGYRVESQDVSIQYFYDQYQITPKN